MLSSRLKPQKVSYTDFAGIMVLLFLAVLSPIFSGGWDFQVAYRGFALSGDYGQRIFSPYPIYWLILPYAKLPVVLGNILWNLTNAAGFLYALRYWRSNILAFSLSLPCFWIFFSGQIEGLIAAAIVMALIGNPLVAGLGITILTLKPQIGLLPIIFVFLHRRDWRLLIVPAGVYLISILHWGWWIPEWLASVSRKKDAAPVSVINISLFPLALLLLPLLWRYKSSLKIWMLAESLAMPYFPVYSLAPYFTMQAPAFWLNVLMWGIFLSALWIKYPISPGFVIPLSLLILLILKKRRETKGMQD